MVSERSSRVIDKHIQRVDIASTHSALHSREEMRHSFGLGISHGRSRNETTVVQHGNKITDNFRSILYENLYYIITSNTT